MNAPARLLAWFLAVVLVMLTLPAQPVAADGPVTGAFLDGEPGASVSVGVRSFTNVVLNSGNAISGLNFSVSNPGADPTLSFVIALAPIHGNLLVPGSYESVQRYPIEAAGHPGLALFGESVGCNQVSGRFVVDDATYDAQGALVTFSARFEQHCDNVTAATFGTISFNSLAPYRTRTLSALTAFTSAGQSQTLAISNNGPSSLDPQGFSISGPIASSFSIESNSCANPLNAGESCSLVVKYLGTSEGDAQLTFSDELAPLGSPGEDATAGTGRDIALVGQTTPPTTTTTTTTTTTVPSSDLHINFGPTFAHFGAQRVGTFGNGAVIQLTNDGLGPVILQDLGIVGSEASDFFGSTNCFASGRPRVLPIGAKCRAVLFFGPIKPGYRHTLLRVRDNLDSSPQYVPMDGTGTEGYFLAGAHGEVAAFGDAVFHGDASALGLAAPMISMATTPNGAGYWLLARDGGIFSFGNARFFGSTGGIRLNKPIVAMTTSNTGGGYRLVASDGGIFAFGDAHFYGSTGGIHLSSPIVGMAATASGKGYWLVASDGGIFAFGDAHFHGSTSGVALSSPMIQITPTPSAKGYWLLAADGKLFPFGDAHNYGSASGRPIVGMSATPDGRGYWEVSRTGTVYAYGDAHVYGDVSNLSVNDVIAVAGTAPALPVSLLPAAAHAQTRATPTFSPWSRVAGGGTAESGRRLAPFSH